MKKLTACVLTLAATTANAFCPTPMISGNRAIDQMAQERFYQCMAQQQQQQQQQQAPTYQQRNSGAINFGILDTQAPARAASAYEEGRQQRLQGELLELQIEQMKRQMNQ